LRPFFIAEQLINQAKKTTDKKLNHDIAINATTITIGKPWNVNIVIVL